MSMIVTQKFHSHIARQFVESLSESANDVYYLFIGRPTPWDSESAPPVPDDSVANGTFGAWTDIIAARRIKPGDVAYVVPRHDWRYNAKYSMYDSSLPVTECTANSDSPYYVKTTTDQVFKCIFNGRANSAAQPANSTTEPTIAGQSDITALTSSGGGYVWKYLYTIGTSTATAAKFLTPDYMPVSVSFDVLNANGDVYDDGTNQYTVFNAARLVGNGAILRILIENSGQGYTTANAVITGDGTLAEAQVVVTANTISEINMVTGGINYSYANVSIVGTGNGATARAIISPRNVYANLTAEYYVTNHGINPTDELGSRAVMLYVELVGNSGSMIATGNDYRRIGIIRNPQLYGTNTRATADSYSQTLDLSLVSPSAPFNTDEIVWQATSNAWGVVVESFSNSTATTIKLTNVRGTFLDTGNSLSTILGIGNGRTAGQNASPGIIIPSTPDAFQSNYIPASGSTAYVVSQTYPDLELYSGSVLYLDQRTPITRSESQTEILRTILTF